MFRRLPPLAVILGLAGLIPFLACGLLAARVEPERATLPLIALVGYGAVILAFLGGVHWGFALDARAAGAGAATPAERERLGLGVVPSLIGWAALLLVLAAVPGVALAVLIAGFVAVIAVEARADRRGLMPPGYIWLRWALTAGVVLTLTVVLVLRLIDARLTF